MPCRTCVKTLVLVPPVLSFSVNVEPPPSVGVPPAGVNVKSLLIFLESVFLMIVIVPQFEIVCGMI